MVSKAIEPLVPLAKSEGVQIVRPKSAAKLRDHVRKRIWFRILWHLALNGPHNKYQLARVLRCRYSSVYDVLKQHLSTLVQEIEKPTLSRAGLPVRRIGINANGLLALLYFDPSILEHLDKVALSNRALLPSIFGNWDVFSKFKDIMALELNSIAEDLWETRHFFGGVQFLANPHDLEVMLLKRILFTNPNRRNLREAREKLFGNGKNLEMLHRLLTMAKVTQDIYEERLATVEDSVRELEEYTKAEATS